MVVGGERSVECDRDLTGVECSLLSLSLSRRVVCAPCLFVSDRAVVRRERGEGEARAKGVWMALFLPSHIIANIPQERQCQRSEHSSSEDMLLLLLLAELILGRSTLRASAAKLVPTLC